MCLYMYICTYTCICVCVFQIFGNNRQREYPKSRYRIKTFYIDKKVRKLPYTFNQTLNKPEDKEMAHINNSKNTSNWNFISR